MNRGRPKGSKNKKADLATSLRIPPACRKCGSEDIIKRPGAKVRQQEYATHLNGIAYRAVRWVPSLCRNCGQAITVRELIGEPKENNSSRS